MRDGKLNNEDAKTPRKLMGRRGSAGPTLRKVDR
jgi:hypothetical protein